VRRDIGIAVVSAVSVLAVAVSLLVLASDSRSDDVSSADEIAHRLAVANITCDKYLNNAYPEGSPGETSNAGCLDAQIDVFSSHDGALAKYRSYCSGDFNPALQHVWLGGNWWMSTTTTTASINDIRNAVGGVQDVDCQHAT
jgi:hypothetical protein